ncbi:hypothetical protein V2I01_14720 [Micromonospora sp. BRA006-A]|nr:hypothetical protein [Micromonospora sp. BRA006-A]
MCRHPGDNDLMAREARALRRIAERGDAKHLAYVPRLVDSYPARDPSTGVQRQVNELVTVPGLRSLDDVRRAYPDGLDPATRPGCGGGCSWRSAWPTGPASCTAPCCPATC